MSMSSLQKKMNTSKMLVFVFLVGLLSLAVVLLKTDNAGAASVQPTSSSTSNWTTTTIQLNWTKGADGDEMFFAVASSTDNITFQFARSRALPAKVRFKGKLFLAQSIDKVFTFL